MGFLPSPLNLLRLLYKLKKWIKCWEEGVNNYNNLDNNKELNQRLRAGFFRRGE